MDDFWSASFFFSSNLVGRIFFFLLNALQDIFFPLHFSAGFFFHSYKMGLGGLHDSYFTFSYASPYMSRSFDQFCFLYVCSGFSKEDF